MLQRNPAGSLLCRWVRGIGNLGGRVDDGDAATGQDMIERDGHVLAPAARGGIGAVAKNAQAARLHLDGGDTQVLGRELSIDAIQVNPAFLDQRRAQRRGVKQVIPMIQRKQVPRAALDIIRFEPPP